MTAVSQVLSNQQKTFRVNILSRERMRSLALQTNISSQICREPKSSTDNSEDFIPSTNVSMLPINEVNIQNDCQISNNCYQAEFTACKIRGGSIKNQGKAAMLCKRKFPLKYGEIHSVSEENKHEPIRSMKVENKAVSNIDGENIELAEDDYDDLNDIDFIDEETIMDDNISGLIKDVMAMGALEAFGGNDSENKSAMPTENSSLNTPRVSDKENNVFSNVCSQKPIILMKNKPKTSMVKPATVCMNTATSKKKSTVKISSVNKKPRTLTPFEISNLLSSQNAKSTVVKTQVVHQPKKKVFQPIVKRATTENLVFHLPSDESKYIGDMNRLFDTLGNQEYGRESHEDKLTKFMDNLDHWGFEDDLPRPVFDGFFQEFDDLQKFDIGVPADWIDIPLFQCLDEMAVSENVFLHKWLPKTSLKVRVDPYRRLLRNINKKDPKFHFDW